MLAKKVTNAVGASWSCSECGLAIAQCGWTLVKERPLPFRDCLTRSGGAGCDRCDVEVGDWIVRHAGGDGRERPLPRDYGRDIVLL
jgi:hypothetical protein